MENESCLNRIIAKSESQNATVTERKIALYIKENLEKVLHCNLLELAELIGVSDASMVRFCKSLGYKGFQEFKIRVAMEAIPSEQQYNPKLQKDDKPEQICHKIFATEIAALQRTVQTLDMKNIKQVAEILGKASRIVFAGTGGQYDRGQGRPPQISEDRHPRLRGGGQGHPADGGIPPDTGRRTVCCIPFGK